MFAKAVRERDADVTAEEVADAISMEVKSFDTNSFAHLWQDGIFKVGIEKEPEILRRCRVLVAMARTLRQGTSITLENLIANKYSGRLLPPDIVAVVNDLVRREVIREIGGSYEFVLPIFGLWLKEVGIVRLVSDKLSEELAEAAQVEEDNAYVHAEEIVTLTKNWPTYRGKQVGTDDVRAWIQQVSSYKDQRLLFTLLKNLQVFGEIEIRQKLKTAYQLVRNRLPEFVIRKRGDRRSDMVVTYVDGEGKSGQYYAGRYAEENNILIRAIISPVQFSASLRAYLTKQKTISAIAIIDDIVATGGSLAKHLTEFVTANEETLRNLSVPIIVVALTGTSEGEARVLAAMKEFEWLEFDFRICEPLLAGSFAFRPDNKIWSDTDDRERAKSLCRDIGVSIYPDNPLGFGDQALLVVFPETCPNNTLPVIHSGARTGSQRAWRPLFPRVVN